MHCNSSFVVVNFTRVKDFPGAKALCNSNLEFDHESQTLEHSEPELDALNETVLGSINQMVCKHTAATQRAELPIVIMVEHLGEL